MSTQEFLEVAVAAPLATPLTYKLPAGLPTPLQPGLRLLVPLGSRQLTGYLLSSSATPPTTGHKLRPIIEVLDAAPLFPAAIIPFYRWLADYYQHPIGEVIKTSLPGGLTPQSSRLVELTAAGLAAFTSLPAVNRPQSEWFAGLLSTGTLSHTATRKIWRHGKDRRLLEKWAREGLVLISQQLTADAIRAKTEVCVARNAASAEALNLKPSESKTLALLEALTLASKESWIARKELTRDYAGAGKALLSLHEKGLISLVEQQVYRDPFGERPPFYPIPDELTAEQAAALLEIKRALAEDRFRPFLLHGVTSSGKTEVYLQAAAHALSLNKNVLVLVPEIALATQLEGNFLARFPGTVALLHSGLAAGERFDQWQRVAAGEARIVIGARSAVFAPFSELGLIIVDEEHDGAYKQEDNFRYQARDAAVLRASQNKATVVLGSATPSITSFYHAASGKYQLLTLANRVENRPLPEVEIIDLKSIKTTSGRPPLFSPTLTTALRDNLRQGNQSLLFLNRRGYANMMLCRDCGQTLQCRQCSISLTLHHGRQELVCHYCGATMKSAALCPHCQSTALIPLGFGTERIEEELKKIVPLARVARLDRDTASSRKNMLAILKSVHQHKVDILVGTQMITKGHHFPNVTLVGVIWADAGLGIPDFKASERTFQLLTQVFGRAGRGEKNGKVLVQTYHPSHYSISHAQTHNFHDLYEAEIELRRALQFPPFSRLVNLRIEGESEAVVKEAANRLAKLAKARNPQKLIAILGPAPAPIAKLRNIYRWQLLLKGSDLKALHAMSVGLLAAKSAAPGLSAVKLSVDVDPENML